MAQSPKSQGESPAISDLTSSVGGELDRERLSWRACDNTRFLPSAGEVAELHNSG